MKRWIGAWALAAAVGLAACAYAGDESKPGRGSTELAEVSRPGEAHAGDESGFAIAPYLQDPGPRRMTIRWSCPSGGAENGDGGADAAAPACEVRFAPADGSAADRPADDVTCNRIEFADWPLPADGSEPAMRAEWVCTARLTGLAPGTAYRYRVTAGGRSADGTFRTFPATAGPFDFAVYGDSRSDRTVHAKVARQMAARRPAFVLNTGDLVESGGYAQYQPLFFEPLSALAGGTPVLVARGNHDGGAAFAALFTFAGGRTWYAFDYANAHFVVLDSCAGAASRAAMLKWAEADLAASRADWKIVIAHHPSYDIGAHQLRWGAGDFVPMFRRTGADLVIGGHSHGYQRLCPLFTPGENDAHPISYMVTAGGGAPLYRVEDNPHTAVARMIHHFVLFHVDGGVLSGQAIDAEGNVFDRFAIRKPGGRFERAYLASARDERDFDRLRRLVVPHMRGIVLAPPARAGGPYTATFELGAGEHAMAFTVSLDERYGQGYEMAPVSGTAPAGGTAAVSIAIRPTADNANFAVGRTGTFWPIVRLQCRYRIGAESGTVYSNRLGVARPTTQPESELEPASP